MIKQVATGNTGMRGVMRSAAFVRGFNEARAKIPMDYDAYLGQGQTNTRWAYERGRLLGLIFQGPLKLGHQVNPTAVHQMKDAYLRGWVR